MDTPLDNVSVAVEENVKPRVLFVDDSRLIRATAMRMFGEDFDLVLAEDGVEAWRMVQADPTIQVVFSDLMMPNMDGFELLSRIKTAQQEDLRELPVVMITGAENTDQSKQRALDMGAADFILKPFDAASIKASVNTHVRYRKATEKLQENSLLDTVTGKLNYRGLVSQLDKDIAFCARHNYEITLLSVQIDAFNELYSRVGRTGAEVLISRVCEVIDHEIRREDTLSRTGLSTFGVSLPAASLDSAMMIAHRISQTVRSFKARYRGKLIPISVSVGLCSIAENESVEPELAFNIAQQAMVVASNRGLDQIHSIDLETYRKEQQSTESALSIDAVLDNLAKGNSQLVVENMDNIIHRLTPIFKIMSDAQKQRVFRARQLDASTDQ